MNQRCIQQPNRCCSPPVSREIPTVSCTGHLAPWCLSLFIVRRFPITRASRGHFWHTSTERCVHIAHCCHWAFEGECGPCSAGSCLDSWTEDWNKEWETEQESTERIKCWDSDTWVWARPVSFGCHVDIQSFQSWGFILLRYVASEKDKGGKETSLQKKVFKSAF